MNLPAPVRIVTSGSIEWMNKKINYYLCFTVLGKKKKIVKHNLRMNLPASVCIDTSESIEWRNK